MAGDLTKAQRGVLKFIRDFGPGTVPLTKRGTIPKAVSDLLKDGQLERLNSLPGPLMVEITPAGRQALSQEPHHD